jgi:hypothetical protein
MTKGRENETLSRLRDFKGKLKSENITADEENWMNNSLRFHIDSQRAYQVNRAQEYQQREGYENFITGGNENKKYANAYANVKRPDLGDDVVHSMNLEELVSMQELIELANASSKKILEPEQ